MKKLVVLLLMIGLSANMAFATPTTEMGDNRAAVVSVYGKDVSGDLTGLVLTASGGIIAEPASEITAEYTSVALTGAALDFTTGFSEKTKLSFVTLQASEAITETVEILISSANTTNYSTVIVNQDLAAEESLYYSPEGELLLLDGDEVNVTCTNNNTTGTVYVTVQGETLN